jgi:hypothetical protein
MMIIEEKKQAEPRYLFSDRKLPNNFNFPESYLRATSVEEENLPDISGWFWLTFDHELANFWFDTIKEQFPKRQLIPFAKDNDSDDVACFDASEQMKEPLVLIIHTFCDPGWEERGSYNNFLEWLDDFKAREISYHQIHG